jgi:hypothetical protein
VPLDFENLQQRLLRELARGGPAGATELRKRLGISQPTFSRLVTRTRDSLLVTGKASATRYAARRTALELPAELPIYDVNEDGGAQRFALLHATLPEGYYVEALCADVQSGFHRDLPYFLYELQPAGFLGRLVPRQHPELELPSDVRLWSSNDVLRYVTVWGWNLPGSLIVGDGALQRYVESAARPVNAVERRNRGRRYAELAVDVLKQGQPGSSAAGEQPKFLTVRSPDTQVMVKFSPRGADPRSRRQGDLLIAEHLAHRVLADHGETTARSELVAGADQIFLEVERFDRTTGGGRRGVLSLLALDAEYLGSLRSWTDSVTRLAAAGHVPEEAVLPTRRRALFGQLIGNTDMHPGNLAFFIRGTRVLELAPVYDMLPMLYSAGLSEAADSPLNLASPAPADADVWQEVSAAARDFWQALANEQRVTNGFRRIARANLAGVEAYRIAAKRLP